MPHKHTRQKRTDESRSKEFNLDPSQIAKPLSTYTNNARKQKSQKSNNASKPKRKPDDGYSHDDTPRAFARMMQFQTSKKRPRDGLDDEARSSKKQKKRRPEEVDDAQPTPPKASQDEGSAKLEQPKILPGERLRDFSARVDQALPVGNLARKGKVNVEGLKERQTKTEKRLHKMYAAWREEDARRKDKTEEQREEEEEEEDERSAATGGQQVSFPTGKRKVKASSEDDPWAELEATREQRKGLHDVVQAPPSFKTVPKEKFKVRNGAKVNVMNVPIAAGSLKRREELSDARKEVIERYRGMMKKSA